MRTKRSKFEKTQEREKFLLSCLSKYHQKSLEFEAIFWEATEFQVTFHAFGS